MRFVPPFCPNQNCKGKLGNQKNWFNRSGTRVNKSGTLVFCFNCKICNKYFSSRTFDLDYWTHQSVDYRKIQNQLVNGSGIRQTCRILDLSWSVLSNRHHRLKRQALGLHAKSIEYLSIKQGLVFDGFESFAYSQYFPNNFNILMMDESQFVVGFNTAPIRRKGSMTESQKRKRAALELRWKAKPDSIYKSSKEMITYGCDLAFDSLSLPIRLFTDKKRVRLGSFQNPPL